MHTHHDRAGLQSEQGYTLVALLAIMSLMALFAMAVAPTARHESQREREKEAIFRGEQVADAIRAYYRSRGGNNPNALPTSMDQLLEGIPKGTKKLQILRPAAAKDPLSSSGEWRLISPTSQDFASFVESVTIYNGGTPPVPKLGGIPIPQMTNILNTKSPTDAPGGEDNSDASSGPFIGVASRSQRKSILTYYGIERHDEWVFSPLFR